MARFPGCRAAANELQLRSTWQLRGQRTKLDLPFLQLPAKMKVANDLLPEDQSVDLDLKRKRARLAQLREAQARRRLARPAGHTGHHRIEVKAIEGERHTVLRLGGQAGVELARRLDLANTDLEPADACFGADNCQICGHRQTVLQPLDLAFVDCGLWRQRPHKLVRPVSTERDLARQARPPIAQRGDAAVTQPRGAIQMPDIDQHRIEPARAPGEGSACRQLGATGLHGSLDEVGRARLAPIDRDFRAADGDILTEREVAVPDGAAAQRQIVDQLAFAEGLSCATQQPVRLSIREDLKRDLRLDQHHPGADDPPGDQWPQGQIHLQRADARQFGRRAAFDIGDPHPIGAERGRGQQAQRDVAIDRHAAARGRFELARDIRLVVLPVDEARSDQGREDRDHH